MLLLLSLFSRVRPHIRQPTRLPHPWDSPGKNTGVGCHFPLQCMKVESEVAQSCPTLSDPMDCSLPGSSIHGILQARVLEWGAIAFSDKGLYKTQISDWKTNLSITWALASVPYPKAIPISYAIIPKRVYIYVHKNTKWKKNQGT